MWMNVCVVTCVLSYRHLSLSYKFTTRNSKNSSRSFSRSSKLLSLSTTRMSIGSRLSSVGSLPHRSSCSSSQRLLCRSLPLSRSLCSRLTSTSWSLYAFIYTQVFSTTSRSTGNSRKKLHPKVRFQFLQKTTMSMWSAPSFTSMRNFVHVHVDFTESARPLKNTPIR